MAGQAKYTNYAPVQSNLSTGGNSSPSLGKADYTLLGSLFGTKPDIFPKSNSAVDIKPIVDRANTLIHSTSNVATADPMWFPKGVYLNFLNPNDNMSAPDVQNLDVSNVGLGGPSTAYTPNLTSTDTTGAGSVEPVPAFLMETSDIRPTLVLGATNGTASPAKTSLTMFEGNLLPSSLLPGYRPGRTLPES